VERTQSVALAYFLLVTTWAALMCLEIISLPPLCLCRYVIKTRT
jgi:hypothetical protein